MANFDAGPQNHREDVTCFVRHHQIELLVTLPASNSRAELYFCISKQANAGIERREKGDGRRDLRSFWKPEITPPELGPCPDAGWLVAGGDHAAIRLIGDRLLVTWIGSISVYMKIYNAGGEGREEPR